MVAVIQALVTRQRLSPQQLLLAVVATVAAIQVVLQFMGETVDEVSAGLVYALLTLLFAVNYGRKAALGAAAVACILVNYFFLEPVFGFALSQPQHVLSLPVYFVVAMVGASMHDLVAEASGKTPVASAEPVATLGTAEQPGRGLKLDLDTQQVFVDGQLVRLTPTEMRLLQFLATSPGRVLTPQAILNRVWGEGYTQDPRILRTYVNQLRSKLGDNAMQPRFISTEPGFGYRFLEQ